MANDDLEIARRILRGAWVPQRRRRKSAEGVEPAVFREIDGRELARQYATHRRIEKASVLQAPEAANRFGEPGAGGVMRGWARGLRARFAWE